MDRIAGVRELKARLSHYLDVAREKGTVVITERGRPVARLMAIRDEPSQGSLDDVLDALAAQGTLERGTKPMKKGRTRPVSVSRPMSASKIVRQMRR